VSVRQRLIAAALAALLGVTSCASVERYARDRALDLTDVVDVRVGLAWGVGAKVEVTSWVGVGLGHALLPWTREWFGRRSRVRREESTHLLVAGMDGRSGWIGDQVYVLGVSPGWIEHDLFLYQGLWPGALQRNGRVGAEVMAGVALGLYVNLGELYDLLAGLVGLDPAHDDGVSKSTVVEERHPKVGNRGARLPERPEPKAQSPQSASSS
jgi:hypothetical protein